ncbi:hypothetical protein C5E45_31065 [Nocardia nova]|uniref:HTH marR-type domain-containing protein n=1 Tax=Nocardia nova TaxID=37330 RepID=A0A2S6AGR6_9NOCA|nr:helix-turn-helix domain-containing protein [Nocardia nova]PPJ21633.1 hypothetical protein C5E41_29405 [Nocardia nova]PPJ33963.1 hypothetical protein C5E45_31065 [Nocardia nova]
MTPKPVDTTGSPASQQTVRRHNRAVVLREVSRDPGRSRAQIAASAGLSRATVSALVDDLLAKGLLRENDADRGLRGRPATPLTLNPDGPAGLGLEINVDYVAACVLDLTGRIRGQEVEIVALRGLPAYTFLTSAPWSRPGPTR